MWTLYPLYLITCHVREFVGDSGPCVCVMSSRLWLAPLDTSPHVPLRFSLTHIMSTAGDGSRTSPPWRRRALAAHAVQLESSLRRSGLWQQETCRRNYSGHDRHGETGTRNCLKMNSGWKYFTQLPEVILLWQLSETFWQLWIPLSSWCVRKEVSRGSDYFMVLQSHADGGKHTLLNWLWKQWRCGGEDIRFSF